MSSPYVYTPHQQYQPFQPSYLDPYYSQPPATSPFIPDAALYPASPYTSAPNTPRRVHFDELWTDQPPPLRRRPSWHAGLTPAIGPTQRLASGYAPPFLEPPFFNTQARRRSFGDTTADPYRPYHNPWTTPLTASPWVLAGDTFLIHPYLNGEAPRPDFYFNLSTSTFSPMRLVAPGQSALLTLDDLSQPATHPPITRLRIVCDAIPQWPTELQYNPYAAAAAAIPLSAGGGGGGAPPITLGDVLIALHRSLQLRISHLDWARLNVSEETAVARAYTRRCRAVPHLAQFEASQGVRRVDYLLDRVVFRGLVRVHGVDGFETLRLVTG